MENSWKSWANQSELKKQIRHWILGGELFSEISRSKLISNVNDPGAEKALNELISDWMVIEEPNGNLWVTDSCGTCPELLTKATGKNNYLDALRFLFEKGIRTVDMILEEKL